MISLADVSDIIARMESLYAQAKRQSKVARTSRTISAAHNRTVAVLFTLLVAMTGGAIILMALDGFAPSKAAYSLSSYLRLDPIDQVVKSSIAAPVASWRSIEVFYSQTDSGNAKELPLLASLAGKSAKPYHFVVCNGNGGVDGQIEVTAEWQAQAAFSKDGVIHICVIGKERSRPATEKQIQRTNLLIDTLTRSFDIAPRDVHFPAVWRP